MRAATSTGAAKRAHLHTSALCREICDRMSWLTPHERPIRTAALIVTGLGALAAAGLLCQHYGAAGYDSSYSVAWGHDIAHGAGWDLSEPSFPTPHPLLVGWDVLIGSVGPQTALNITAVLTGLAWLVTVAAVARACWLLPRARGQATAALAGGAVAAIGAPMALLTLGSASDVWFLAVALWGCIASLQERPRGALLLFTIAALIRPEALLFAALPMGLALRGAAREARLRLWLLSAAAIVATAVAWIVPGSLVGRPSVAFTSASGNAALNHNPRGLGTALRTLLPSLAQSWTWLIPSCSGLSIVAVAVWIWRSRSAALPEPPRGRSRKNASVPVRPLPPLHVRRVWMLTTFLALDLLAFLIQGAAGTPLVARYVLLAAALCIPLAVVLPTALVALWPAAPRRMTLTAGALVLLVGAVGLLGHSSWHQLDQTRHERATLFAAADELLDRPLVRQCPHLAVRSPALVPYAALHLGRPLSTVTVSRQPAADGVLLQPRTVRAAVLAGYGPYTDLHDQGTFPVGVPLRAANADWALYSACQP